MIFNHCVTKLAIQNALRFSNKFSSLKNTQNYIFNFGQFRHLVHGFDLAWIVPLRIVKKFCRKLSIIIVGTINEPITKKKI